MYRLIVESLLGLHLEVDQLRITPCLPADWTTFRMHYRYRATFYQITVRAHGANSTVTRLSLDGTELPNDFVTLVDDGRDHAIEVDMHSTEVATSQS